MSLSTLDGTLHRGCGGRYALQEETVTMRLSGMAAEVTRGFFRCEKCGHEQRTIEQRDAAEKAATEQIRALHELMAPKAIRQFRESLGLTVAQFADLIYGTPKGIVEGWEKGKYLQNREADAMIRSLADRAVLEQTAAKAGVTLPVVEEGAAGAGAAPAGADAAKGPTGGESSAGGEAAAGPQ